MSFLLNIQYKPGRGFLAPGAWRRLSGHQVAGGLGARRAVLPARRGPRAFRKCQVRKETRVDRRKD